MATEKTIISITSKQGEPGESTVDITTNGFVLLYLKDEKIETTGTIDIRALAPIIMKSTLERFSK